MVHGQLTAKRPPIMDVTNLVIRVVQDIRGDGQHTRVFECKCYNKTYTYALIREMGEGLTDFKLYHIEGTFAPKDQPVILETLTLAGKEEWGAKLRWIEMVHIAAHLIQAHVLLLDEAYRERTRKTGGRNAGRDY